MLLTLGSYAFTYTSSIARGFALAQLLVLAGVVSLLAGRRTWHACTGGLLFGAATLTNYLAVFPAARRLLATTIEAVRPAPAAAPPGRLRAGEPDAQVCPPIRRTLARWLGVLLLCHSGRLFGGSWRSAAAAMGQFPPFSLIPEPRPSRCPRRRRRCSVGFRFTSIRRCRWFWRSRWPGCCFGSARAHRLGWRADRDSPAPGRCSPSPRSRHRLGLLALGAVFNNTPIEVRYLAFSTPFLALLLAGALGSAPPRDCSRCRRRRSPG